jgi:hypothetical protein
MNVIRRAGSTARPRAAGKPEAMRAFAASGGEKPSIEVPESLIARRRACAEAGESAAAAASAREALSKELDAAKAALADAERSTREAALAIVLGEAARITARLDAMGDALGRYRRKG